MQRAGSYYRELMELTSVETFPRLVLLDKQLESANKERLSPPAFPIYILPCVEAAVNACLVLRDLLISFINCITVSLTLSGKKVRDPTTPADHAKNEELEKAIVTNFNKLLDIEADIEKNDLSLFALYNEIALLYEHNAHQPEFATFVENYAWLFLLGYPLHLIHGTPYTYPCKFVETLLSLVDRQCDSTNFYVVSIIGAQSTAKSSLLNSLFGCSFLSREGRCTRGVYTSYARTTDGTQILVLDTEGILSIENTCDSPP